MPCHESNHGDFFFQIYTEYHLHGIPHEFNTLRLSPDGSNGARCYCTHTPSFPHSLVNENQTNHQSKRQMFTVVVYTTLICNQFDKGSCPFHLLIIVVVTAGSSCAFRQLKLSAIAQYHVRS